MAKMNEKCQDVHLSVPSLGSPPPIQTISWLLLKCDIYLSKVNLSSYDKSRKCHNFLQNKMQKLINDNFNENHSFKVRPFLNTQNTEVEQQQQPLKFVLSW